MSPPVHPGRQASAGLSAYTPEDRLEEMEHGSYRPVLLEAKQECLSLPKVGIPALPGSDTVVSVPSVDSVSSVDSEFSE